MTGLVSGVGSSAQNAYRTAPFSDHGENGQPAERHSSGNRCSHCRNSSPYGASRA